MLAGITQGSNTCPWRAGSEGKEVPATLFHMGTWPDPRPAP